MQSGPSRGDFVNFEVNALSTSPGRHQLGVYRVAARENLSRQSGLSLLVGEVLAGGMALRHVPPLDTARVVLEEQMVDPIMI